MKGKRLLGVGILLLIVGGNRALGLPTLQLNVADCAGGFNGTLSEGSNGVHFRACPGTGDDCHSRVGTLTGEPIVEVRAEGKSFRAWLAGIEITETGELTEAQLQHIANVVRSPSAVVGGELFNRLVQYGIPGYSPAMQCLNSGMQAFEWSSVRPAASIAP